MSGHGHHAAAAMLERRTAQGARGAGVAGALGAAGLCVAGMAATWLLATFVPAVRFRDALALHDFTLLSRPHVNTVAHGLLSMLEPGFFTALGLALVAIALARRRPRVALAVALVMALAPLTAELLKPLLAHVHDRVGSTQIASASWPSGHATAALALVLCAVLVSPARLRPAVATLGALFAAAVGCALLILAWHMPSDVLGGYLVAALWTVLAVAGLRAAQARWPAPSRRALRAGGERVRAVRAGIPQRL